MYKHIILVNKDNKIPQEQLNTLLVKTSTTIGNLFGRMTIYEFWAKDKQVEFIEMTTEEIERIVNFLNKIDKYIETGMQFYHQCERDDKGNICIVSLGIKDDHFLEDLEDLIKEGEQKIDA